MTEAPKPLPADVRLRIDQHLDAVEKVLEARGWSRSQRRGVTDDLETQFREMLAARVGNAYVPTPADVEAVLRQLDSPASYGREGEVPSAASVQSPSSTPPRPLRQEVASALPGAGAGAGAAIKSRLCRPALAALALIVFSLLPMILLNVWVEDNAYRAGSRARQEHEGLINARRGQLDELKRERDRLREARANVESSLDGLLAMEYSEELPLVKEYRSRIKSYGNDLNRAEQDLKNLQAQLSREPYFHRPDGNTHATELLSVVFLMLPLWAALALALQALVLINDSQGKLYGNNLALIDIAAAIVMLLGIAPLPALSLLAMIAIAFVGYRRSWFRFSSKRDGGKTDITLSVDQRKMKTDREQAVGMAQEFAQHAGETLSGKTQNPADVHG